MATIQKTREEQIWAALQSVKDPEIPVISVVDLGIITKVAVAETGSATVTMTPTFTACPAIDVMKKEIQACVADLDFVTEAEVVVDFSVAWTSDLITETGRQQIKEFGLAPPAKRQRNKDLEALLNVNCPHCESEDTSLNNLFGPTLCRSIHFCYSCKQAFQAFKPV